MPTPSPITSGRRVPDTRRTRFRGAHHRLTIERQSKTLDDAGAELQQWTALFTRRGMVEPLNGREYFTQSGEQSEVTTRVRFRYDSQLATVRPFDRLVLDGNYYNIKSIIPPELRKRELIFMCVHDGANQRYP